MSLMISLGALNVFDLRPASAPAQQGEGIRPQRSNFIQNSLKSDYSLAHPRVNDSAGVSGESSKGKMLPYLLA